jgi:hypothetical protein
MDENPEIFYHESSNLGFTVRNIFEFFLEK